ncbi:short-chain dehydrogenase [Myxococcus sp. SDU36]|nr:short-chain dehydrogenase [Myxococcus sp. SDU36]WIG93444.1 short-chain dehydrogenase [Myxococcus sp. SDU36]
MVRLTLTALEASEEEVLADDVSRMVKQGLSSGGYLGALSA